ncbi:Outer spore wall assembly protein SHE10, partial [Frankliniella fusca]
AKADLLQFGNEETTIRERKISSSSSSSSSELSRSTVSTEGEPSDNSESSDYHSDSSEQEENVSSDESDSDFFSPKIYEGCNLAEDEGTVEKRCSLCNGVSHKFFQIPLADQIRNLFENHRLADLIDKYNSDRGNLDPSNSYADLLDGSEFKRAHVDGAYNLDLMGHY